MPAIDDLTILSEWVRTRLPWITTEEIKRLGQYVALLYRWSAQMNLIGPGDRESLIIKHLIPALKVGVTVCGLPHERIMDLGSGGGLPGIPLKIILEDTELILVESRRKRANFLREAVRQLSLRKIEIVNEWVERNGLQKRVEVDRVDIVVSRAVAEPGKLLKMARPYLKPHGVVVTALRSSNCKGEKRSPFLVQYEGAWWGKKNRVGVLR